MVDNAEFYQSHLDKVSRSFAFCIRQLPDPLRGWVALSYLLCRILDTIEDSQWPDHERQFAAFQKFDAAIADVKACEGLVDWEQSFPDSVKPSERALLADAEVILQDLHELSSPIRDTIGELVRSMSLGMQHFVKLSPAGHLRLHSLAEVNQYCFFVAGLVGELLSKLIEKVEPRFVLTQIHLLRAHHFGLFLQKVNLLKDQHGDEVEGRNFIPSREQVEDSAAVNATNALDFLLALPREQIEFRRFCAWSLFLGLEALVAARDGLKQHRVLKISRDKMSEILGAVENALGNDGEIRSLFNSALSKLGWPRPFHGPPVRGAVPEWLRRYYRGRLDTAGLQELGI